MIERDIWVDYAKAIGIILVVYGHVARGVYKAGILQNESTYKLIDSVIYSFHMPLFFFLSGLYFYGSLNKRGERGLIASKIDTIVYPYFLWSIIQGVSEVYFSSHTNNNINYVEVFSLLWQPRAQFWFLYALFMVFIIASFIFSRVSRKYIFPVFIVSIFIYIYQNDLPSEFHINYITDYFVFFVFGVLFNMRPDSEVFMPNTPLLIMLAGFIIFQYTFHVSLDMSYENKGVLSLALALLSILFVVNISKALANKKIKWLVLVGTSSMAIYLMHILASRGAWVLLKNLSSVDSASIYIIAGLITGIVAPLFAVYLVYRFRVPYVFSMPICQFGSALYRKLLKKVGAIS